MSNQLIHFSFNFNNFFCLQLCSSNRGSNADQSVAGVSITSKSTSTQAVLANAVVYFEYDQFNLTTKSIQALKGVSELMNRNQKSQFQSKAMLMKEVPEYNLALVKGALSQLQAI